VNYAELTMQEEDPCDNDLLGRARRAVDENDLAYAKFLYMEALAIDQQNNEARTELHRLRENVPAESNFSKIKFAYHALRILLLKVVSNYDGVISAAENLLEIAPHSNFALKSIFLAAHAAKYHKLVVLIAERVREAGCDIADLVIMAKSFLNEKIFDQAIKIAKEVEPIEPDNEEIKEILWKASVEKHANSDVQLMTAGADKRFIPPKIDAEKIFIASHRDAKDDKRLPDQKQQVGK
jgi:tetratricopeptide (TPR) repeat protein